MGISHVRGASGSEPGAAEGRSPYWEYGRVPEVGTQRCFQASSACLDDPHQASGLRRAGAGSATFAAMGAGAWRASRRGRRATPAVASLIVTALLAGCGSSDFANDPRPPAPIKVAAKIDADRVAVSPNNFGAGLVTFSVANSSDATVRLELSGPAHASTSEIKPGEPGYLQVQLPEGDYQASAVGEASAKPASFTVAKERPSSDDKLLLP